MTNRDRAIFGTAWAVLLAGLAVIAVLAIHPMGHSARPCTFDGGGTIASGDAARVTTGQVFACQDGQLIRIG